MRTVLLLCSILVAVLILGGCTASDAAAEGRRRWMSDAWQLYQADSREWPAARQRWFALGGPERETLVLSLIKEIVRTAPDAVKVGERVEAAWRRPQRELLELDDEAVVPFLIAALERGRDPVSQEAIADTLARFGAVDPVIAALDASKPEASAAGFIKYASVALVRAGGQRALERVGRELARQDDWQARAAAADALGEAGFSDAERAAGLLAAVLADADDFVVRQACDSLAQLQRPEHAPAIAAVLERALARRESATAESALDALRLLTGAKVAAGDIAGWRREAEKAARRRAEPR